MKTYNEFLNEAALDKIVSATNKEIKKLVKAPWKLVADEGHFDTNDNVVYNIFYKNKDTGIELQIDTENIIVTDFDDIEETFEYDELTKAINFILTLK